MFLSQQLYGAGVMEARGGGFHNKRGDHWAESRRQRQPVVTTATSAAAAKFPASQSPSRRSSQSSLNVFAELKAWQRAERLRFAAEFTARADLLARTVHLRFLPTAMRQGDLAALCGECGEYLRVRICGNSTSAQNWIYGFVEFADRSGAEMMLRRSGMELSNGVGRPPLRLKCNGAKQAIVDRIFHDADPVTNTPCIFGLGSFANRTLREAVESYYNLKRKDSGIMADYHNMSAASRQPYSNHNNNNNKISSNSNSNSNGFSVNNNNNNSKTSNNSSNSNVTLHEHAPWYSVRQENNSFWPPHLLAPTSYNQKSTAEATALTSHFHPSWRNTNETLTGGPVFASPPSSILGIQSICSNYHYGTCNDNSVLQGKTNSLMNCCTLPSVSQNEFLSFSSLLLFSKTRALVRGKTLILEAMKHAKEFFLTNEKFYASIGSLQTVIRVLDEESEKTKGINSVTKTQKKVGNGEVDKLTIGLLPLGSEIEMNETNRENKKEEKEDEEDVEEKVVTQRLTQMRLLAYLLLSLLYSVKGNSEESLRAINNAVAVCKAIPIKKLQKPNFSVFPTNNRGCGGNIVKQQYLFDSLPVNLESGDKFNLFNDTGIGDGIFDESFGVVNPIYQTTNFFSNIDMEIENEQEATIVSAAMGVLPPDEQDTFFTESLFLKEKMAFFLDVQLQSYVLSVLITIAFSMQSLNSVVTHCVYSFACSRAKEVFGSFTTAELELKSTTEGVQFLREKLLLNFEGIDFIKIFFECFNSEILTSDEVFWSNLPPFHMVRWCPLVV